MADEVEIVRQSLNAAGLLAGYTLRLWEWTDEDLNGASDVICIGFAGTGGASDFIVSKPDVSIQMLAGAGSFVAGRARMAEIRDHFYSDYSGNGAFLFLPVGEVVGPSRLVNGRRRFELLVRIMTDR